MPSSRSATGGLDLVIKLLRFLISVFVDAVFILDGDGNGLTDSVHTLDVMMGECLERVVVCGPM